ncbi:cupin domain-containing protein [Shewanella youngdeokensis]|uniref:Cupin domain-containing protein n=1 Tax=Shewanella youngdeokensis TaxID=2999068 RepID=A0ABZ0JY76_9GAMM|nr:cupin domain-containing protein [Shewanella sp. DAU334]
MTNFSTKLLPTTRDVIAPDGSDVRVLLTLDGGSMAHFELAGEQTSIPSANRTVDEIWYIVAGRGEMWRMAEGKEEVVNLAPGVCLTIPSNTHFQFRAFGSSPLQAVAITMPPWPGDAEPIDVDGPWVATVSR